MHVFLRLAASEDIQQTYPRLDLGIAVGTRRQGSNSVTISRQIFPLLGPISPHHKPRILVFYLQ